MFVKISAENSRCIAFVWCVQNFQYPVACMTQYASISVAALLNYVQRKYNILVRLFSHYVLCLEIQQPAVLYIMQFANYRHLYCQNVHTLCNDISQVLHQLQLHPVKCMINLARLHYL
jgi:hypothetical protein